MSTYYRRLSDSSTAYIDQSKPKQVKLGKYTICPDSKLGSGSFSSVYLCEDKQGNKAATKILNKHSKKSEHIIKVAKSEVKVIRKLKHPNIVGILGSFESENNYYILFEYCEGKTIRDILSQHKTIELESVLNIVTGLINAFCYLHQKKVMHRDIKPDNIKYFKGKTTLIDFGFACQLQNGQKTILNESVGTPSYMSPEMLQSKSYNYKSDIWSLGVVIYEIIYGRLPWYGRSENQLFANINKHPLTFPNEPKIKDDLKKLIQGCLEKKALNRIGIDTLADFKKMKPSSVRMERSVKTETCDLFCWFH